MIILSTMDYTYLGEPFVDVPAKLGLSLEKMDYVFLGQPFVPNLDDAPISGTVCWGHVTGVLETNTRTFAKYWTGSGTIENSGDTERLAMEVGDVMMSGVVSTGTSTIQLLQNNYASGDTLVLKYRHAATILGLAGASWNSYTVPFASLGYVQVQISRVE